MAKTAVVPKKTPAKKPAAVKAKPKPKAKPALPAGYTRQAGKVATLSAKLSEEINKLTKLTKLTPKK